MQHRTLSLFVTVLAVFLFGTLATSPAAASDGAALIVSSVSGSGCNENNITLNLVSIVPNTDIYTLELLGTAGGAVFTDVYGSGPFFTGTLPYTLFSSDQRGLKTLDFPLPPSAQIRIMIRLYDTKLTPVWENLVVISNCTTPSVLLNRYGPVQPLVFNGGFEDAGAAASAAALWTKVGASNDRRMCNTATATFAHTGECAFRIRGTATVVDSLTQNYPFPLGKAGDALDFSAWVNGTNAAGGQVDIRIVKQDGTVDRVKINLETGNFRYTEFTQRYVLTQPIRRITTRLLVRRGSGVFFFDTVRLSLVVNGGVDTSALALPEAADTGLSLRGQ